jgi:hypothetical protein
MLTFYGHWHSGEVCSSLINAGFNCTRRRVGIERFADVNVVNRVPHGGVIVWAGISYGPTNTIAF